MTRMRFTTQAIDLFSKALADGREKDQVGSENLSVTPDGLLRLQVRETLRQAWGTKLGPADVQRLQRDSFDKGKVTDDEAVYLLQLGLDERNFAQAQGADGAPQLTDEARAARFDLLRFAVMHLADVDPDVGATEKSASVAANSQVMREYVLGSVRAVTSTGEAEAAYLEAGRAISEAHRAKATVTNVPADADAVRMLNVFLQQTDAIGGWSFLKPGQRHNVLVKPGINWGINGYPTVSSWESVYAAALGTHLKGSSAGSDVKVTVADESGIENKDFGRTTMDNMEDTGILGGAVLAGLENHFRKSGKSGPAAHHAAVQLMAEKLKAGGATLPEFPKAADVAPLIRRTHTELISLAEQGGVVVVPLDEQETMTLTPVAKAAGEPIAPNEANMTPEQLAALKHFKAGIRVSTALSEVTDIINLPKPPGRHGIMSNCGLTGAVKNYIGLLSGVDRTENLHSRWARTPPRRGDETAGNYQDRLKEFIGWLGDRGVSREKVMSQGAVNASSAELGDWRANEGELLRTAREWVDNMKSEGQRLAEVRGNEAEGPGQQFFEKLAELNLFFKDKERFTFTDMRQTVSSFGPDFGEKLFVGAAIASDSASVVDAIASGLLKGAYERSEGWKMHGVEEFSELEGASGLPQRLLVHVRDALSTGYQTAQGARFMRGRDPFRLKNHAAVMQYPGLAPTGMHHVDLKLAPETLRSSPYLGTWR